MPKKGTYYLGRVVKRGILDQRRLMDAIVDAHTVTIGKFAWTITDVEDRRDSTMPYIFGMLSKFAQEGHVTIVDTSLKSQVDSVQRNLLVASSPFIYLPDFSGIAYMHVWNEIQDELFPRRFKTIIETTYEHFFVDCSIEPVSDYKAFSAKLSGLDRFTEIYAKVYPPNPLFGRLWGGLNDYVRKRNASEITVKESREDSDGLKTKITALLLGILENPDYQPDEQPDITDAAILMAADGYGMGKVTGIQNGEEIIIRTSDTQKSFLFGKEPNREELAKEAYKHFKRITEERDMRH